MKKSWFQRHYSAQRFWQKLSPRVRTLGRGTIEKALYLYFAALAPDTPKWAKRTIYGALGYFIFPLDSIPDIAPLIGYTDDLSVLAAALATVAYYITPEVKDQAHRKIEQWFDSDASSIGPSASPSQT